MFAMTESTVDTHVPGASVEGNARVTGMFGAVIFVLLFVEGVTILRVDRLISAHVFVGVLLVPLVVVKLGSTGYRFARYYTGRAPYVEKGPPPIILRLLGPVVSLLTVAVLLTGIGAVLRRDTHWIAQAHKASFILWFGAMTVHVLGHALETPALALADLRSRVRRARPVPGRGLRTALLGLALAAGLPLAIASLGWAHHWQQLRGH
jgi:hypothetical protein